MQIVPKPNSCKQQAGFYLVPESSEISCVEKTDDSVSAEGYHLKITQSKVEITASTPQGLFYAKKSLQQLRNIYGRQIPCFTITDSPAFSYRGFMIDCCRHFFPIAQLKQMIEAAALFKLNRFHWHLTDDQGWRIAVEQYPRLTEIGASRPFFQIRQAL